MGGLSPMNNPGFLMGFVDYLWSEGVVLISFSLSFLCWRGGVVSLRHLSALIACSMSKYRLSALEFNLSPLGPSTSGMRSRTGDECKILIALGSNQITIAYQIQKH
jgi:hypothetical protein